MSDLDELEPRAVAVRLIAIAAAETVAAVDYEDGAAVIVRHEPGHARQWRCKACGRHPQPGCIHARAVALMLEAWDTLTTPTDPADHPGRRDTGSDTR